MPIVRPADNFPTPGADADAATRIQSGVGSILARQPEIAKGIGEAQRAARASGTLSRRLQELLRLRIAFHNQCRSCMAVRYEDAVDDGLTEGAVCSLERPEEADDLSEAERAALRFADLFATNHFGIDEAVYDDLRLHFSEDELVEIGLNCAMNLGIGRLVSTWKVTDDLPEAFQESGVMAPWNAAGIVVPALAPTK